MGNCCSDDSKLIEEQKNKNLILAAIAASTAAAAASTAAAASATSAVAAIKQSPTKTKSIAERIHFIANLQLEPIEEQKHAENKRLNIKDDQSSAAVVDGMIAGFAPGVSKIHQSDVKNSMLLAQLAANNKYDRYTDVRNWYKFYVNVLENIGWAITDFNFVNYESSSSTLRMDKVVLEILTAVLSQNELVIAKAAIDALSKLPGDNDTVTLFENGSTNNKNGNFQVGVSKQDKDGNVTLGISCSFFETSTSVTRFLWWSWATQDVTMFVGNENIVLDEDVYGQIRDQIINKLGDRASTFVRDIQID